ncbi:MAG: hypothetical protein HZC41_05465 [Chloroflexi bacterium]|nr:hypothetical protein [Chloroflexota bacterium]
MQPSAYHPVFDGSRTPPPESLSLCAGPLTLTYEAGSLRYIRLGSREVLHQIYAAVRDHNWGTVPGQLHDVQMDRQPDSFHIRYRSEHRRGAVQFDWIGDITGAADGTITFRMDGAALSTFKRNRIGFCVLHPMDCAGQPCTIETVSGDRYDSQFPVEISPHQPFYDLRAVTHEALPGVRVEVRMDGDTFEMEDQRNWTDASFKTYCTPLGLPFPVTVEAGTKISQTITLRLIGAPPRIESAADDLTFTLFQHTTPLPPLGLGVASHGASLSATELERLKALHLAHLRVDVRFGTADYAAKFRQAALETAAIGGGLEVALFLTDAAEAELAAFHALLDEVQPAISRWLVFHRCEKSTTARWVTLARQALGAWAEHAPVGAGTDAFFTELNRERPPLDVVDFVTYSLCSTVHAVDNASVTETLAVQAETVKSARAFSGGKPVMVSPVTFKMRWNPNATGPEPATPPGELPPQVDARQPSLYGAGWTLGSIRYLAESGAASVTYYETTGWRGVMETAAGSPVPEKFHSVPGGVYPMYHVLADVGEFRGGDVIASQSSDILRVNGLALRQGNQTRLLLANYTPYEQTVRLPGVPGTWSLKLLDANNAESAMSAPDSYRTQPGQTVTADANGLRLTLPPFAVARLDG